MGEDYSRALARVVVAQIAEVGGFGAVHDSAGEVLAELLVKYTVQICSSAKVYAELAGRTSVNVADVILSLEDLGECIEDLENYTRIQDVEVPFRHSIGQFPVRKQLQPPPSFTEQQENPPAHIPPYLPAFPDSHTYIFTPSFASHEEDVHKQRQAVRKSKEEGQAALLSLQRRVLSRKQADNTLSAESQRVFLIPTAVEVIRGEAQEKSPSQSTRDSLLQAGHMSMTSRSPGREEHTNADVQLESFNPMDDNIRLSQKAEPVTWRTISDDFSLDQPGAPADWTRQAAALMSERKAQAGVADARPECTSPAPHSRGGKSGKQDAEQAASAARALTIFESGAHVTDAHQDDQQTGEL